LNVLDALVSRLRADKESAEAQVSLNVCQLIALSHVTGKPDQLARTLTELLSQ